MSAPEKEPHNSQSYLAELAAYISVDVETAGPCPNQHALLSIGACTLVEPRKTFYVELQPDREDALPEALAVSGLSMERLKREGVAPTLALRHFETWLRDAVPGNHPLFVAFNAAFDWMFLSDYFCRYIGYNPFGHSALDIKAYYMGMTGSIWKETSMYHVGRVFGSGRKLTHNALQDAIDQGEIFLQMLTQNQKKPVDR
jgi:DNA polymerase III epsilon subunit-like protein